MYEYVLVFLFTLCVTAVITQRSYTKCTKFTKDSPKAVLDVTFPEKVVSKGIVLPSLSLQKHEECVRLKMQWKLSIKN